MRGGIQLYDKADTFIGREVADIDIFDQLELSVYPNPAHSQINWRLEGPLALGDIQVTVRNLLGSTLYSQSEYVKTGRLDISLYPKGVYFLTIESMGVQVTRKFIVSGK